MQHLLNNNDYARTKRQLFDAMPQGSRKDTPAHSYFPAWGGNTRNFHGAIRVAGNEFRDAAEQESLNSLSPV